MIVWPDWVPAGSPDVKPPKVKLDGRTSVTAACPALLPVTDRVKEKVNDSPGLGLGLETCSVKTTVGTKVVVGVAVGVQVAVAVGVTVEVWVRVALAVGVRVIVGVDVGVEE